VAESSRIQAGQLRHRIVIVQPKLAQDSSGGWKIDDENIVATVWASVEGLIGRELFAAQQKVSEVTHKITIRWMSGLTAKMNVWFDERLFQIEAIVNPNERHKMLVLLCIERNNSANQQGGAAI
jgi:SPP1 family predicted phage head-tail adaptor